MQRIFNYEKWQELSPDKALQFSNARPRKVVVEVNAPDPAILHLIDADGVSYVLAGVHGRDTIEFWSRGAFSLITDDGSIWVYTADGDDHSSVVDAPVKFTKIAERRRRSPELERIAFEMQANMNRRLEHQANELAKLFAASEATRTVQYEAALAAERDRLTSRGDDGRSAPDASDTSSD